MSVNAVMAQTFLEGVRNWNTGVNRRGIEVFDPKACTLGRYIDVEKAISSIQWSDVGVLPWENFNLGSPGFHCACS